MTGSFEEILNLKSDGTLCVSAIIFDEEGRILLGLRNYRKKIGDSYVPNPLWTTPGGRTEKEETVGDSLIREALEETGLAVTPVEYWGTVPAYMNADILHVFLCEYRGIPSRMEPDKFEKWNWFMIDEIPMNFINTHLLGNLRGLIKQSPILKGRRI